MTGEFQASTLNMLKTFLGVDLKIGGQIILWLHLVENLLLFLVIALRTHVIPTNATREFIVILRDYKIGRLKF